MKTLHINRAAFYRSGGFKISMKVNGVLITATSIKQLRKLLQSFGISCAAVAVFAAVMSFGTFVTRGGQ